MSENERNRVNSTRDMIPRAIHARDPSLQSKPLLKAGCLILSSHLRFVRVAIESMRVNFCRIRDTGLWLIRQSKDPDEYLKTKNKDQRISPTSLCQLTR